MLEREVKLAAPPAFALPDLEDLAAAVEVSPVDEQRLENVYYDTRESADPAGRGLDAETSHDE
jgi:inorganic triphosphatase YgiF